MDLPNSAHQWQDGNSHAKTTNVPNINAVDTSASQTARTPLAPDFFVAGRSAAPILLVLDL